MKIDPKELQNLQVLVDSDHWHALINKCTDLLSLHPTSPIIWNMFGLGHFQSGNVAGAKMAFEEAMELDRNFAPAHFNHGNACRELGQLNIALNSFKAAVALETKNFSYLTNLGNILCDMGLLSEAVHYLKAAVETSPNSAVAHFNLANVLKPLGQIENAEKELNAAVSLDPTNSNYKINLALLLEDLGRFEQARDQLNLAILDEPNNPRVKTNLGHLNLREQDFKNGWPQKEFYWKSDEVQEEPLKTRKPLWQGGTVRRLFIWAEQGIGDQIMYASCFNELNVYCDQVLVSLSDRLVPLFQRSFSPNFKFKDKKLPFLEEEFDAHSPGMTALGIMRPNAKAFESSTAPYLKADATRVLVAREYLSGLAKGKPIFGLSWFSDSPRNGFLRSVPIHEMVAALPADCLLVNLQYGNFDQELKAIELETGRLVHSIPGLDTKEDLDGLAAGIMSCDEVITIDNSVAHLSGALGKNTNVLLPFGADWRWSNLHKDSNLWYKSVRLNRQSRPQDWSTCFSKIKYFNLSINL